MHAKKWILPLIILLITIQFKIAYADDNNIISFKKTVEEHITRSSAVGISINSREEIALGFNDEYINVYNNNGKFIYGYSFKLMGSYVFTCDETDNIMIFPSRAGECYYFNTNAKLVKTRDFSNTAELNKYYRSLLDNKELSIHGNHYKLSNYSFGHTILTKTDANGNITIIYDIGKDYAAVRSNIVFGLLFIILIIVHIRNYVIKGRT